LERGAPPQLAGNKIKRIYGRMTRSGRNESAKLDRPRRLFRDLRRSRLFSLRMNGCSLQRMTSMSLKARRRSSIWALRVRTSGNAADGTTKRLMQS
jgi:hypothetical protein